MLGHGGCRAHRARIGDPAARPAHRRPGTRPGAGRKSTGRQPVLLRLTPKTLRALRAAARKQGKTLSEVAEERLVVA